MKEFETIKMKAFETFGTINVGGIDVVKDGVDQVLTEEESKIVEKVLEKIKMGD